MVYLSDLFIYIFSLGECLPRLCPVLLGMLIFWCWGWMLIIINTAFWFQIHIMTNNVATHLIHTFGYLI